MKNGTINFNQTYTLDYETDVLGVYNAGANVCNVATSRTDNLNITNLWDNVTAANNQTLSYSPANRLTNASGAYGTRVWGYDGVGNRTSETSTPVGGSATARTYTYPATNNKLSNVKIGATTERAFVYDGAGNITSDTRSGTAYAYAYNKRNRLNTVRVAASLKGTYTYNGLEQLAIRVSTNQTPAGTTHFIHDIFGNVIAETNGALATPNTVKEYIWLPETQIAPTMGSRTVVDRPLAVVNAVNTATPVMWWVHVDHLNRPVKMTDAAKAAVWTAVWTPWGGPHSITGTATLDARFPGQWYQLEAGLHYNWHRSYDPSLGRYTQPDTLGFVDGPSVFGYAIANPQRFVDRDGRMARPLGGTDPRPQPPLPDDPGAPEPPKPPKPGIPNPKKLHCELTVQEDTFCVYDCGLDYPPVRTSKYPWDDCDEFIGQAPGLARQRQHRLRPRSARPRDPDDRRARHRHQHDV
ncbi:MAG: RHS repeat-associated core domain-containing protein [Hyphomicrobium sp.]